MLHGFSNSFFRIPGIAIPVIIIIIGAIVTVAIGIYFTTQRKKEKEASGLSPSQKETLDSFDSPVLSMLTQHGGCLTQQEIRNHLGLPVELVAQKLLDLEKEGSIQRKWLTDDYTFCVQKSI
jgi:uncharacterized membrane protein